MHSCHTASIMYSAHPLCVFLSTLTEPGTEQTTIKPDSSQVPSHASGGISGL